VSAINQLIATQSQRTSGPSPIELISNMERLKGQKLNNQIASTGLEQNKRTEGLKFAANVSAQLQQAQDPAEKANIYASARQLAQMNGHDITPYPEQYTPEAEQLLNAAYMQVYQPEKIKEALMQSDVGKLVADRDRIAQSGGDTSLFDDILKEKQTKKPLVSITNEAEKKGLTEEQKALAKSRVGRFEKIQNTAQSALDQNEQLDQLSKMDVSTGFGEPIKVNLARAFNALGADGDKLMAVDAANAQSFNAVSGKLLAEALAAQKGPQTDRDADRMMETLPRLSTEQDANKFIIGSMRAINQRKVEQSEFYEKVLESEGTLKEADKKWRNYKRSTPLLSDSLVNKETGLPIFFNEFLEQAQQRNPNASRQEIVEAWRKINE
jgi:hypothetical protein